ncbi:hypothetical protein GA0074692_6054 [Micromonospora pallida]|uniref:PLAT/LH2 domain-containing protein n=1 Tax=Micromonospora pallida TaxID=145854 RepID=A0A1C6TGP9_9ACTN|nr:hypothetical protein [Micromonospora pallida]SCL40929.1 hypothetical protein GA0074692_6054 [Micromonospora pallida]
MRTRISRLRAAALLITATLLATLGVTVIASPASAGPIACNRLSYLNFYFRTGGDDLRGNSEVIPYLITTSGDVELQHVWGGFGGETTNFRTLRFLDPGASVNACSVTGLRLRMVSHPSWPETTDNWNMDTVSFYGYSATNVYSYHFYAPSFFRFTGSQQWWPAAP